MTMMRTLKQWLCFALMACAALASVSVAAQNLDELANAARQAARTDRNRESADLFEQLLALAPQRRGEWLLEYAEQLTYSQRAAKAVPLFREFLALQPAPAQRRSALKGLALALSWADRPSESRLIYETILAEDSDNIDLQRSLGRVISWSGRQREAQTYLRDFVARHPSDQEGRFLLAQAQWWLGRSDAARATLAGADPAAPKSEEERSLQRSLNQAGGQSTRLEQQHSTQSDQLDIANTLFEHEWTSASGLTLLAPRWQSISYKAPAGEPGVTVERAGARMRQRFADDVEFNLEAATDTIRPQGLAQYSQLTYSSWLTWWPSDVLRLDVSSKRETFDDVRSLQRAIAARGEGVSLDWLPDEFSRLTARWSQADYSDGNQRNFGQFELERRLSTHPWVWAGLRATHFDFARQLDNGYFNPLSFNAYSLTLRANGGSTAPGARLSWSAQLAAGTEHANPDGNKPSYDLGANVSYRVTDRTTLEARLQRFSSLTASASGFARTTAGVTLVYHWNTQ